MAGREACSTMPTNYNRPAPRYNFFFGRTWPPHQPLLPPLLLPPPPPPWGGAARSRPSDGSCLLLCIVRRETECGKPAKRCCPPCSLPPPPLQGQLPTFWCVMVQPVCVQYRPPHPFLACLTHQAPTVGNQALTYHKGETCCVVRGASVRFFLFTGACCCIAVLTVRWLPLISQLVCLVS